MNLVHDKVGIPKPLPFFNRSGIETLEVRGFSVCWGNLIWSKNSSKAEGISSCHWGWWSRGPLLLGGHVDRKVHHPVAVAKFIVIPGNELDEMPAPALKVEE